MLTKFQCRELALNHLERGTNLLAKEKRVASEGHALTAQAHAMLAQGYIDFARIAPKDKDD